MSTNLRYEQWVKQNFGPNLGRLRVYTKPASYNITCYVEDQNGDLPSSLKDALEAWFEENRLATMRYEIKPFNATIDDGIPPRKELPVIVEYLALNGQITVAGVEASLLKAFPYLNTVQILENQPSLGHITLIPGNPISEKQAYEIALFSPEFMPPGIVVHIN